MIERSLVYNKIYNNNNNIILQKIRKRKFQVKYESQSLSVNSVFRLFCFVLF